MQFFTRCVWGAAVLTLSASAVAALPNSGLWSFDDEANGKPGRGIQIDRQGGETVIASYFGYRTDGSAVFYQAVGKMTDGKTFKADLIEYKGGTVVGGKVQDASESKTIGVMQAEFDTPNTATVSLPNEQSKAISLFAYEDHTKRLNNEFLVSNFNTSTYLSPDPLIKMQITASANQLIVRISNLKSADASYSLYTGDLVRDGTSFSSLGRVEDFSTASIGAGPRTMKFENLTVNEKGIFSATFHQGRSSDVWKGQGTLLGMCYRMPDVVITGSVPIPCTPEQLGLTTH